MKKKKNKSGYEDYVGADHTDFRHEKSQENNIYFLAEASAGCGNPDGLAVFTRSDIKDALKDFQFEDMNDETTVYYMTDSQDPYEAHTIAVDYYKDYAYSVTITNDDYYAARKAALQMEYEAQKKLIDERTEKMNVLLPDGTSENAPYKVPSSFGESFDSYQVLLALILFL